MLAIERAVTDVRKPKLVAQKSREVKQLEEEEADAVYHEALEELFADSPDPLEVIKWNDMFDKLEDAVDECEDVANVLQSISLKHS